MKLSLIVFFILTHSWSQHKTIVPDGLYVLNSKVEIKEGETYGYSGEIMVAMLDKEHILLSLNVNKGAPSYNSGAFIDTLVYKNNKAIYKNQCESDPSCVITFSFTKAGIEVVQENENPNFACGFGHAVFADGFYKRRKNVRPTVKEILESDEK